METERKYKFDLHVHTKHSSDCNAKIEEIIKIAKERGIGFIGITDHNSIRSWKKINSKIIIPGIEVSSKSGHILGLYIEDKIPKGLSAEETIRKIHEQKGLAIAPHPFEPWRNGIGRKVFELDLDGVEVFNSKSSFLNFFNFLQSKKLRDKAKIAASDAHFPECVGYGLAASKYRPKKAILKNEVEIIRKKWTSIPKNIKNIMISLS